MTLKSNNHDTTIIYDIDNLSSEGAEARVLYGDGKIKESTTPPPLHSKPSKLYGDGKIKESTTYIYGAGGKTEIEYIFASNFIRVREQTYLYQDTSLNKLDTLNVIRYKIDYRGNVVGKRLSRYTDMFEEFKRAVPFILKRQDVR